MKGQFFPYKDENISKSRPVITYALIAINVAVFFLSLTDFSGFIEKYAFVPGAIVPITILTAMFLHGGFDHIFGNMWYLFLFGDNVEDRLGKIKYIMFYLLSGLAATFVHWLTDPKSLVPTLGASGAISGVLGAYLVFYPHVRVHVASYYYSGTVPAAAMIGFWFVLQLILGTVSLVGRGSGIAFWAHVGGFVFGAAVALLYKSIKR
ncbi:MAG: rhomboid family intramembrane serine protease [Candidatus Aenigmarchaeota archaeon]|nr:rhomboid family intramembrane serine protease [Candidatus Aenigmarchaeota archaeon]